MKIGGCIVGGCGLILRMTEYLVYWWRDGVRKVKKIVAGCSICGMICL